MCARTRLLCSVALTVAFDATLLAQFAGQPPAATVTTDSSKVELPPFVVDVSTDRGYAATETLAGTRMRTSLRDVGASLTVLTPEFLQDLAATSLDKALLYT